MKLTRKDKHYVIEFGGNRDLPENEQATANIKLASITERQQYSKMVMGVGKNAKKGGSMNYQTYLAIQKKVTNITNFEDNEGNPIDNGYKLVKFCKEGWLEANEIAQELFNVIMGCDIDEKEESDSDLSEGEDLV